jgi:hypothetical protein
VKKEVKVGIVVIVAIALFIYGFNFLKGHSYFTPTSIKSRNPSKQKTLKNIQQQLKIK